MPNFDRPIFTSFSSPQAMHQKKGIQARKLQDSSPFHVMPKGKTDHLLPLQLKNA